MMFNFKISNHRPSGIQPSAIGLWSAWPGLALALALIMASPQVRAQTPAPASAQAAANQAQQAVAVCSAVLSAYQLRQRDTYLASQQASDDDAPWAQAAADGRRLEQATLALVQLHLESAVAHPALP